MSFKKIFKQRLKISILEYDSIISDILCNDDSIKLENVIPDIEREDFKDIFYKQNGRWYLNVANMDAVNNYLEYLEIITEAYSILSGMSYRFVGIYNFHENMTREDSRIFTSQTNNIRTILNSYAAYNSVREQYKDAIRILFDQQDDELDMLEDFLSGINYDIVNTNIVWRIDKIAIESNESKYPFYVYDTIVKIPLIRMKSDDISFIVMSPTASQYFNGKAFPHISGGVHDERKSFCMGDTPLILGNSIVGNIISTIVYLTDFLKRKHTNSVYTELPKIHNMQSLISNQVRESISNLEYTHKVVKFQGANVLVMDKKIDIDQLQEQVVFDENGVSLNDAIIKSAYSYLRDKDLILVYFKGKYLTQQIVQNNIVTKLDIINSIKEYKHEFIKPTTKGVSWYFATILYHYYKQRYPEKDQLSLLEDTIAGMGSFYFLEISRGRHKRH